LLPPTIRKTQDITTEDTGANTQTDKQFIYDLYTELLKDIDARPGITKTETYEEQVKKIIQRATCEHEAAHRGGQAAHRF